MTVRDNILFGKAYDPTWYRTVVDVCCLLPDFKQLPNGEMTEIGERGINLSGGQKQRISLARAVYADHAIYLLDDALSAVDAHVGRRIFDKCIRQLLKGKTVLLVTHQLQYLPRCDRVAFMHNQQLEVGLYSQLLESSSGFKELIRHHHEDHEQEDEDEEKEENQDAAQSSEGGSVEEETAEAAVVADAAVEKGSPDDVATGGPNPKLAALALDEDNPLKRDVLYKPVTLENSSVSWSTYVAYARATGGSIIFLGIIFLFLIAMAIKAFSDWYLSYWIREGDGTPNGGGNVADNPDRDRHALIFGMTVVAMMAMQMVRGFLYTGAVLRASTSLHSQLFSRVLGGTMAFFNTTPLGRIINRFAKDTDELDSRLVLMMEQFLQNVSLIIVTIVLIAYALPYFLVALVPITTIFVVFVHYFGHTQRQVKRLDNMTQAPLFSHLTASLQGLATINAFQKRPEFERAFFDLLRVNARCFFSFYYCSRWFGLRLDYVSTIIMAVTGIIVVTGSVSPTLGALALTYALSLGGHFQFSTRLSAEVEGRFTSAERILDFIRDVPLEDQKEDQVDVPAAWPDHGAIEFNDVEAAYREELPPVTKNLTFSIRAREKIGIAGRTGAGKSTLAACLYRMMEMRAGHITIDGLDIEQLSLHTLRSHLSMIPQVRERGVRGAGMVADK